MRHSLRKLVHHYHEGGIAGFVPKIYEFAQRRCWSEEHWAIYVRDLTCDLPSGAQSVVRRELRLVDLVSLGYFKAKEFPEGMEERFSRNNACHGFFLGDRLATVGWSSPNYLELDRRLEFPCSGAAGLFDFLTFEEFRSRGFYTSALLQLAVVMRRTGFARDYIAVDPGNVASIKGIERAGFRPAFRVTRRWRFGVRMIVHSAGTTDGAVRASWHSTGS